MRPRASTILRRLVPSPACGPARARSCAGWCPPRHAAPREHDLAQVGALPGMRPRASTILRRLVPSPACGPARARSCAGWCPPRHAAPREHDLAQVGALPGMRPRASTILRRLVPSPACGPARARSCAGWCPPRHAARAAAVPRTLSTTRIAAATGLQHVDLSSPTRVPRGLSTSVDRDLPIVPVSVGLRCLGTRTQHPAGRSGRLHHKPTRGRSYDVFLSHEIPGHCPPSLLQTSTRGS